MSAKKHVDEDDAVPDGVVLFLKMSPELKGALRDLAKKKGLSLSAYVRMELMSHVERQNFGVQS